MSESRSRFVEKSVVVVGLVSDCRILCYYVKISHPFAIIYVLIILRTSF